MMLYRVYYSGSYVIQADSVDEALETSREDYEVEYDEWENTDAELWRVNDGT